MKNMTKEQFKKVKALVKNECANYIDGYCLACELECPQIKCDFNLCPYFERCVLPIDKSLMNQLTDKGYNKACKRCGQGFNAGSPNKLLCDYCTIISKKEKKRNYMRNIRDVEKASP